MIAARILRLRLTFQCSKSYNDNTIQYYTNVRIIKKDVCNVTINNSGTYIIFYKFMCKYSGSYFENSKLHQVLKCYAKICLYLFHCYPFYFIANSNM